MKDLDCTSSTQFLGFSRVNLTNLMSLLKLNLNDTLLLVIVILSLGLNGFWLWWGLPSGAETWEVDGIAPLEPLVAAKRLFIDDWWNSGYINKYPMGHFFIVLAVYAPYIVYLFVTGGLSTPDDAYPYGLSEPEMALTVLTLLARGVSVVMGLGIAVLVYLTARDFFGKRGAFFAALIVVFSPAFIYYSHTANVDVPSLFWGAVGLFGFARLVQGRMERFNYLLLGFAVGMGMATKEQVFGLFALLPIPIVVLQIMHHRGRLSHHGHRFSIREVIRVLVDANILWGLGTCILTFVLATHMIFNWDANVLRLVWRAYQIHPEVGNFPYQTTYPVEVSGLFDGWRQTFWLLWDSMNPFLLVASIAGVLYFPFKERWAGYFLVPFLSYLFLVIPTRGFLRVRFVMELALVLAFFGGRFLSEVWSWGSTRHRAFLGAFGLLWAYSLIYGSSVNFLMMYDSRYKAELWIRDNLSASASVETYSEPTYLPRLPQNLTVHRLPFSQEALAGLRERSPDYLILTGAKHNRFKEGSPQKKLFTRLLQGDFGYQPLQTFQTEFLLAPNLVPGLSPEIIILTRQN